MALASKVTSPRPFLPGTGVNRLALLKPELAAEI
jgi:hypothetical protein